MLTKLDALYLHHHWWLTQEDECYYGGEYTAGKGFSHSVTNQHILNLKKGVERRHLPDWYYKERAIEEAAANLRASIRPEFIAQATFVPIPPSRAADDPLYDDRMTRVLRQLGPDVNVRELVRQTQTTEGAHVALERPSPTELYGIYEIDQAQVDPVPTIIAVVDDVLTAGAHFKAMQRILKETYPDARVVGFFIARRVPGTE